MTNGHFHISLDSGTCINETQFDVAVAKAMAIARAEDGSRPVEIGFACTYGCGQLHPIVPADMATLTAEERQWVFGVSHQ